MHLVSIAKFPSPSSGIHFLVPKIPPASLSVFLHVSSCIFIPFQCLGFTPHLSPTFFALILFQYRTFPFPQGPSISCIHFVSYVDFPHWPLHHFLRFYCFNTGTSPASKTSGMHLVSVSKFPPACARSKETCTGSKKEGAKAMWAPITMEFPPHPMEARSTKQAHGSKKQKPSSKTINLAVEKIPLGPAQIHAGPKKISPQGPVNTQASPPYFLWP